MGQRGPAAKPDWLKVLDGDPGRRLTNKTVKAPLVDKIPPPEHFNAAQRAMLTKICEILSRVNALSVSDQFPLFRYVELSEQYRRAQEWMSKNSDGNVAYPIKDKNGTTKSIRTLPQLKAMLEISNHLLRIEQHFGLTPSGRSQILRTAANGNEDLDIDPFA